MTKRIFIFNKQKGVSMVITFLIMTIMLAIVLSISIILFNEVKIISNMGSSESSFYAAFSGLEKTLYFDAKQIPSGGKRGLCNICNACGPGDCNNCTTIPLALNGCNIRTCNNCRVTYDSTFDNRNYTVDAKVTPNLLDFKFSDLYINSKGFYRGTTRTVEFSSAK